jgi:ribosomal protein S18 acetylase RimI-like enzyme
VIRAATVDDAAAIAMIQARGWRHAYADIVAPEDMRDPSETEPRWREWLVAAEPSGLVFDLDGNVTGFAFAGRTRDGGDEGELYAIYVEPSAQGAGVGTALLAAAVEALVARGFERAHLWVFEANGLARAFYERHGWRADDDRRERLAGVPELRYRRELPPTALAPGTEPPRRGTPRA